MLQAARNSRNNTVSTVNVALPLVNPSRPTLSTQPLIIISEAINISIKALNRRLL